MEKMQSKNLKKLQIVKIKKTDQAGKKNSK